MKISFKTIFGVLTSAVLLFCAAPRIYAEESSPFPDAPEIVAGETINDGTLVYTKSRAKGCVYITSCQANLSEVIVPNEIDGYKVLGIYDGAFAGISSLTSVKISDGIEYIGSAAFYECGSLTQVTFPRGLTVIPDNCFCYCKSLKKAELPETVTALGAYSFAYSGLESFYVDDALENIGYLSFAGCQDLKEFTVSDKNSYYEAADGILYSDNLRALEIFPIGKENTYFDIPGSVAFIQPGAFHYSSLEDITMTDNVQWIGATAFSASKKLEKVRLSNNLEAVNEGTFSDCTALRSINIPDSVKSLGSYAFYGCNYLKSVSVSDNVELLGEKSLGLTDDETGKEHKINDFKIKASYNSAAGKYARENGISIEYTDGNPYKPFIIAGIAAGVVLIAAVIIIIVKKKPQSEINNENNDYESDDDCENDDDDESDYGDNDDDDDENEYDNDEYYTGSDTET